MGSVRDLYTTGDNDPEIEPQQYYRHYLYCDSCGSFDLHPSTEPGELARTENKRHRLAMAAFVAAPFALVGLWSLLGFVLSPAALVATIAAMVIAPVLRGWATPEQATQRWRLVRWSLLAVGMLLLADALVVDLVPAWLMFVGGLLLVLVLLTVRLMTEPEIGRQGLVCRGCNAAYAYGTPFFSNLDANPRNLTVAEVPRPLGSSQFLRGASVETNTAGA